MAASRSLKEECVHEPYTQAVPEEQEDIVSTLPKEIRTKIIDLLPIQDALRTCILSNTWREVVNEDYCEFSDEAGFDGTYLCLCLSRMELNEEIVLSVLRKFRCVQKLHLVICQQRDARCSDYLQQLPYKVPVDTIPSNSQLLRIDNFEGRTSEAQLLTFFLRFKKSLSEILIKMPKKLSENDTDR